jgi:hypothetical protein
MNASHRPLNLRRIGVLARHTFTQLVRMKVFYFLAIFAIIVIGANSLELPTHAAPESAGVELLYTIKNTSIGCMSLFSIVIGIVATGLLLPKDVEDRTLYTILAKPVPRLDYLLGKFAGVAALILVSLVAMDLLMSGILQWRLGAVLAEQRASGLAFGYPPELLEAQLAETRALGPSWNLQGAVLVVYLRSLVIICLALLLSTFSTSTLFTATVGFLVVFIGFFQADAREAFFQGGGVLHRLGAAAMTTALPDLQLYNLIDAVIEGEVLQAADLLKITGVTGFYFAVYTFAAWLIFARKEF